jgi:copper oxidase (laccase) domain-containing protein
MSLIIDNDRTLYWRPGIFSGTNFHAICVSKYSGFSKTDAEQKLLDICSAVDDLANRPVRLEICFGSNIPVITRSFYFNDGLILPDSDGVLTNVRHVPFYFQPGDCLPIFLWDKEHQVGGLLHASWKQIPEIPIRAINQMMMMFESNPMNIIAAIGPSIGPCCYKFERNVTSQVGQEFWQNYIQAEDDLISIDLQAATIGALNRIGVINIETANICTCCAQHDGQFLFPSYFRDKTKARLIATFTIT